MYKDIKNSFRAAEVRLSYAPASETFNITGCDSAERYFRQIWDQELMSLQEQTYALYLNSAGDVVAWRCLNTGSSTACHLDIKLMLSIALGCAATQIIIAHNHPSGNAKPSKADDRLTQKIKDVCQLVDLELLDHLILTMDSYYSYVNSNSYILRQWNS